MQALESRREREIREMEEWLSALEEPVALLDVSMSAVRDGVRASFKEAALALKGQVTESDQILPRFDDPFCYVALLTLFFPISCWASEDLL